MQDEDWKIYVMFHKVLIEENYKIDPRFDKKYYQFVKANESQQGVWNEDFFDGIVYESEFPFYNNELQKNSYHAPSIIYHIYKNLLFEKYKSIGFLEYDIPLSNSDKAGWKSFTQEVMRIQNKYEKFVIPFRYVHTLETLKNQSEICLNGNNAIEELFSIYNRFWGSNHDLTDYLENCITTQQSFMCDRSTFMRVMRYISYLIESKVLESAGTWHRPSTLLERAFGIALLLEKDVYVNPLLLSHQNMKLWEDKWEDNINWLSKLRQRIAGLF